MWLFDRLVWTVLSYGVEIWGGEEENRKFGGKIYEVGDGSGQDTGIYDKAGNAKGAN